MKIKEMKQEQYVSFHFCNLVVYRIGTPRT